MNPSVLERRKENVFIVLSSLFICAMVLLNVIGLTHFVQLGPLAVAVGVLPYPLTFLCTDLISEIYGKQKARFLVTIGFGLNIFIWLVFLMAQRLPSASSPPPWQILALDPGQSLLLANGSEVTGQVSFFYLIYATMTGALGASMLAYLLAQYCDVYLFHWIKKKTKGKHLWLRNNASTIVSQLVDSVAVMSVTFGFSLWKGEITLSIFLSFLLGNYTFKFLVALLDTPLCYGGIYLYRKYVGEDPFQSYESVKTL